MFDLVILNLEVPITTMDHTLVCKGIHLKTLPEIIDVLKYLHIGAVCLANNHICDYGIKAMMETTHYLEQNGIPYYGVNGKSLYLCMKNEQIALHGYCCYSANGAYYIKKRNQKGVHALTRKCVISNLAQDKKDNRLSIISFHWGDEYSQLPNEKQVRFIHELASQYTFILHGHHTHAMQGIQKIYGSLACYRQGNFCFDEVYAAVNTNLIILQNDINKESYILSVMVENANIISWSTIGFLNEDERICFVDNHEKIEALSRKIERCSDDAYKRESAKMIRQQKEKNLGKKDLCWLKSKLNYYSIGAKLLSCILLVNTSIQ